MGREGKRRGREGKGLELNKFKYYLLGYPCRNSFGRMGRGREQEVDGRGYAGGRRRSGIRPRRRPAWRRSGGSWPYFLEHKVTSQEVAGIALPVLPLCMRKRRPDLINFPPRKFMAELSTVVDVTCVLCGNMRTLFRIYCRVYSKIYKLSVSLSGLPSSSTSILTRRTFAYDILDCRDFSI